MMGPPGRPGGVVVGYPPRIPAQARVCTAPGDVPTPCPRGPKGYRSMVRVAGIFSSQKSRIVGRMPWQNTGRIQFWQYNTPWRPVHPLDPYIVGKPL
eukprot:COSAG01_NODE_4935_length_4610_cov_45.500111_1_plen_97_part_00